MDNNLYKKYEIDQEKFAQEFMEGLKSVEIPKFNFPVPDIPPNPITETNQLLNEQIEMLKSQNEDLQKQADEAKKYNRIMLIIAIIAAVAAVASPIVTVLVSR